MHKKQFEEIAKELATKCNLTDICFVGKGGFKETYWVKGKNSDYIALKIWDPAKFNLSRSQREIDALQKCNTSLIGKLYIFDVFHSSNGKDYHYSQEEFLEGGTLANKISSGVLTDSLIRNYAITLIKAIDYLRCIDLVHRDIKPDNIMFRKDSNSPVLVDLGIARDLSATSLTQTMMPRGPCTPYFAAPEQLNNEKHLIDWRTDQFSLGIVMGICLTKKHPFAEMGTNDIGIIESVSQRKKCTEQFRADIIAKGFRAIIKMIEPWPIQRYQSTDELLKDLEKKE